MALKYTCPNIQAPIVDPKTGKGSRAWYQYFGNLFDTVSSTPSDILSTTNVWTAPQKFTNATVTSLTVLVETVSSIVIGTSLTVTSSISSLRVTDIVISNQITSLTVSSLTLSSLNFANPTSNSLATNVSLTNTSLYFTGPSVTQGSIGTWYAQGTVTLNDSTGTASMTAKLWDGTTVIASTKGSTTTPSTPISLSLSGFIISPVGNLRISVKDSTTTQGAILFNTSGESKDSTLTAYRIG